VKSAILAIPLLATTVGIGQFAHHVPGLNGGGCEQDDLLGQLFGSGRKALSHRFVDRADLYFHGGVHDGHQHEELFCDEEHDDDDAPLDGGAKSFWAWLNGHIHPSGNAHLKGERYEKEVIPWIWAAIAADPHNVDAYLVGSYWLTRRMHKPEEALKLLARGVENNSDVCELDMARAEVCLSLKDDGAALDSLRDAEAKWRARPDAMDDPRSREVGGRVLVYLGILAERAGDTAQAAARYREALPLIRVKERVKRRLAHTENALRTRTSDGLSEQG